MPASIRAKLRVSPGLRNSTRVNSTPALATMARPGSKQEGQIRPASFCLERLGILGRVRRLLGAVVDPRPPPSR